MTSTQTKTPSATTWIIDPAHTNIEFSAKHLMITTVKGRFGKVSGKIVIDPSNPAASEATVEIDATTIDTRTADRDTHLKSADFLDVEKFPTLTFRSKAIKGSCTNPGDRFELVGDLTIRGVTKEVVLNATYEGQAADPWGGTRVSFSADTKIDRRDFGLTWNVALETGGILVGNEIKISIEVQATREAAAA